MSSAFSICVYCGSRDGALAQYIQAAQAVGTWIGQHQGQLVYGGGSTGLMGQVARATHAAGGRVVGVIPQALVERELANNACDELIVVHTMHERKRIMADRCDAFLALPGGIGTFEELFEVWTWRQLGYHHKPIGLLNVANYYDPLLSFIEHSLSQAFITAPVRKLLTVGADPAPLLQTLVQSAGLAAAAQLDAL